MKMEAFGPVRIFLRSIPNGLPGKSRVANLFFRLLRTSRPVRIPDLFGNCMTCPSLEEPIAKALFAFGVYDPDTIAAVLAHLGPLGSYVDVGANIGAVALPVASRRAAARIIC